MMKILAKNSMTNQSAVLKESDRLGLFTFIFKLKYITTIWNNGYWILEIDIRTAMKTLASHQG